MARAKSFVSPIQTIDENTSKQTNLSTGPAFYNLDPIDNDFRTSWTSLQSLTILNFFVGPPFDDVPHAQLHLLHSLGVDTVLAVHVARFEKLARLLYEVKNLLERRLVVDVERQGGERALEVREGDVC